MGPPIGSSQDPDFRRGPLLPLVGLRRAEVPKHDGAQHLRRLDVDQAVVRFVARHACALSDFVVFRLNTRTPPVTATRRMDRPATALMRLGDWTRSRSATVLGTQ